MVRTKITHGQVIDRDFVSEAEGATAFLFRDGYGTNNNLTLDGYLAIKDTTLPAIPSEGGVSIYYHDGYLSSIDAYGIRTIHSGKTISFPDALSLELQYYLYNPSFYTEVSYNIANQIVDTDIWDSSSKNIHIFNKHFTWIGNQVSTILITRLIDGQTLQKNFIYDGYGKIINVNRTYI